ncbi:hypothetical protein MAH1_16270 [Sessilibacter sp. MAH1]
MVSSDSDQAQAVVFINNNHIEREMLYSEFEAVLDSFIPLPELAGRNATAVYLQINKQLMVESAVFFRINFNLDGFPDKTWNVPLMQLASIAARGPNLGAGPIKLACYTQCPIANAKHKLWDPEMAPGVNHFAAIKKVVARNRLSLPYEAPPSQHDYNSEDHIPTLNIIEERRFEKARILEIEDEVRAKYQQSFRNRLADTLKKQRLQLATLRNKHRQKLDQVQLEHKYEVERLNNKVALLEQSLADEKLMVSELQNELEQQIRKMGHIREYFEEKLKSLRNVGEEQFAILHQRHENEVESRISEATDALNEQLQMRDIELMYLTEHQKNLAEEVSQLQEENNQLKENTSDKFLSKLSAAGISFAAYQSGIGHINIDKNELLDYIQDPELFAAQKSGVSVSTYKSWLGHFKSPTCQALKRDGSICGCQINRVTSPMEFHPGESDRCEEHSQSNVIKFNRA